MSLYYIQPKVQDTANKSSSACIQTVQRHSNSPVHPCSDIVEQAFCVLILCCQSVLDYQLPFFQCQLLVKLYNLHITRNILTILGTLQTSITKQQKSDLTLQVGTQSEQCDNVNTQRQAAVSRKLYVRFDFSILLLAPVRGKWLVWM